MELTSQKRNSMRVFHSNLMVTAPEPTLTMNPLWNLEDKTKLFEYCMKNDIRVLRDYQLEAIKRVREEVIEGLDRHLLVMATGTGKTRVSISTVEILMKANWVKNVLFLADRTSLVSQAFFNFQKLLQSLAN